MIFRGWEYLVITLIAFGLACISFIFASEKETSMTTISNLLVEFRTDIILAEGRARRVYLEPISKRLHGGIGHLLTDADFDKGFQIGSDISDAQIQTWFERDYDIALKSAFRHFDEFLTFPDIVQLAVLNWLWQLGAEAPERFPRATAALNNRDWATAADEWLYGNVKVKRWSLWRKETQHRCEQEAERLRHAAKEHREKHR